MDHKTNKKYSVNNAVQFLFVSLICLSATRCANPFESFGNTTSDEALLDSMKINLNDSDFTGAVSDCLALSADYLAKDEVKFLCASAYAGRGGFQMLSMLTSLQNFEAQIGTKLLLDFFMFTYTGTVQADITDLDTAEGYIRSIGVASARTNDQNTFMVLLTLFKMGAIANLEADGVTDDGTIDGTFTDACADVSAANSQSMRTAMWELNNTLLSMTSTVYTTLSTAVQGVCTALAAVNGGVNNVCAGGTLPATNASLESGARMLIHEGVLMGLDTCAGGPSTFANCICP